MHITGFIGIKNTDHEYLIILNEGGLTIPSQNLVSATENILINRSKLTSRNAAKEAPSYDGML